MRPIVWDMTNAPKIGFGDKDLQQITYSQYYGQNCFKESIYNQLCGWLGSENLWTGAVCDSDYNWSESYLEKQQEFQSLDLVKGEIIPFLNIYDKGFWAKLVAYQFGRQLMLQPDWAKSD